MAAALTRLLPLTVIRTQRSMYMHAYMRSAHPMQWQYMLTSVRSRSKKPQYQPSLVAFCHHIFDTHIHVTHLTKKMFIRKVNKQYMKERKVLNSSYVKKARTSTTLTHLVPKDFVIVMQPSRLPPLPKTEFSNSSFPIT